MRIKNYKVSQISDDRVKKYGEVYTPKHIVENMCNMVDDMYWQDENSIFLEPACGNGNFLVQIFKKRRKSGILVGNALNTIFGMDILPDNINDCHNRLLAAVRYELYQTNYIKGSEKYNNILIKSLMIIQNNIFQVEDSISYIKNGHFENKKFVFIDPTEQKQILSSREREKLKKQIKRKLKI